MLQDICRGLVQVQGPPGFSEETVGGLMSVPRHLKSAGPAWVNEGTQMWALESFSGAQTNAGSSWVAFRGRGAVGSVVGVLHKGRTQPDSVNGPRDGPRSIFRKLGEQMDAEECLLEA